MNFAVSRFCTNLFFALLLLPLFSHAVEEAAVAEVEAEAETRFIDRDAPQLKQGQKLYAQHCASCHDNGVARAPHPSMLSFLSTKVVHATMTEGVMREQARQLSDPEKVLVAEYVTRQKLSSAPKSNPALYCSGAARDFDWNQAVSGTTWGFDLGNTHSLTDAVAGMDASDVPGLQLKWAFEFPGAQRARSQPLVAGGAVFTGSQSGVVYALDADTGCIRWTFAAAAEVRTGIAFERRLTDMAAPSYTLYFGDLLGRVYALDAQTGDLLWRLRADDHPSTTITGTPTVYAGRVYVPVSSLEVISASSDTYECCVFRGSVLALDAETGAQIWRTYTIENPPSPQGRNRVGVQNHGPSGAPIWNSPTIDVERSLLYVGTGENYSSPPSATSDSILALKLDTGAIAWTYQATLGDAWNTACSSREKRANCPKEDGPDLDFGASAVLATTNSGQDVVVAGQKSGAVHGLDPTTGKLLWKTQIGRGGLHGGVHFGLTVSGTSAFIPISDAEDFQPHETEPNPGLFALDISSGEYLWKAPLGDECRGREFCDVGIGAAISATQSLVFAGALDGYLRIHAAKTGKLLRKIDTTEKVQTVSGQWASGGSMDGGSAAVPFGGRLYVNSGYNFAGHMAGNVLLVYAVADAEDKAKEQSK